jgi:hypothetical protein
MFRAISLGRRGHGDPISTATRVRPDPKTNPGSVG